MISRWTGPICTWIRVSPAVRNICGRLRSRNRATPPTTSVGELRAVSPRRFPPHRRRPEDIFGHLSPPRSTSFSSQAIPKLWHRFVTCVFHRLKTGATEVMQAGTPCPLAMGETMTYAQARSAGRGTRPAATFPPKAGVAALHLPYGLSSTIIASPASRGDGPPTRLTAPPYLSRTDPRAAPCQLLFARRLGRLRWPIARASASSGRGSTI